MDREESKENKKNNTTEDSTFRGGEDKKSNEESKFISMLRLLLKPQKQKKEGEGKQEDKREVIEKIEEHGRKIEEVASNLLGYHSFYGRFSIFLFLSSILFFIALSLGKKELLSTTQILYYLAAGLGGVVSLNFIKIGYIVRMKGKNKEEMVYLIDVLQTIVVTVLLYVFVNIAVGNDIYSLYRTMLLLLTMFILFLSYLARRDVLFKFVVRAIYNTNVAVAREYYKGSGKVIIMNQEIIDKVNYYSSYFLFLWYLLSFSLTFINHTFYSLKLLLYLYFLPFALLIFSYSFLYSYFRKRAV